MQNRFSLALIRPAEANAAAAAQLSRAMPLTAPECSLSCGLRAPVAVAAAAAPLCRVGGSCKRGRRP